MTLPADLLAGAPDPMSAELAAWGRVLLLQTRGRRTGMLRVAPVGYVREPEGTHLIAAGGPDTAWARNLLADPACRIGYADVDMRCLAEALSGDEAAGAVTALILRYGTPAEGLGSGPVFRLVPIPTGAADPA